MLTSFVLAIPVGGFGFICVEACWFIAQIQCPDKSAAGTNNVVNPGEIYEIQATPPASVSIAMVLDSPYRVLVATVVKDRTCPGETGLSDGALSKDDYPDPIDFYSPPSIELELVCDCPD